MYCGLNREKLRGLFAKELAPPWLGRAWATASGWARLPCPLDQAELGRFGPKDPFSFFGVLLISVIG